MAQSGVQLDRETFSCSICLDLLKDPATLPCGHSYCMGCIKTHWDEEDQKPSYSCPQCRQAFSPRPALVKSTVLADLVEELKKTGFQAAAAADLCYAGPGDMACDFCTGRKLKASKSCLQCLVSYCEKHIQPHYESPAFKKHKLVEPSKKLQENICPCHGEVMNMFCRTDELCICNICLIEEHDGHRTVSAEAERTDKQRALGVSQQRIKKIIQDREKHLKVLQTESEAINGSADTAVEESEKTFTTLIRLIQKIGSDVKQQIRSQQETEVSQVKDLQEELEQEITELKSKNDELDLLSRIEDHIQFLHKYPSLSPLRESIHSPSIDIRPLRYFDDVTAAVSKARDVLQDFLKKKWSNISLIVSEVDVLLPKPDPKTRAGFLKYARTITLDPNTAHCKLNLSEGNRKITTYDHPYPSHPDRFLSDRQALSKESLTGKCYWEVTWRGEVSVAVAYKDISREGYGSAFGANDKSWTLDYTRSFKGFRHKNVNTHISDEPSRLGVYLDHSASILSFYDVSETMTLIHRVWTTFTRPLYAGLGLRYWYDETAEFTKLN